MECIEIHAEIIRIHLLESCIDERTGLIFLTNLLHLSLQVSEAWKDWEKSLQICLGGKKTLPHVVSSYTTTGHTDQIPEIPTLSTKKGGFWSGVASCVAAPTRAADASLKGVWRHALLGKFLRYVPLRCHFLHFDTTLNGK